MASTYSSNLRYELIGAGEQVGTWGTTANTNIGTLIEGSVAGFSTVSVTTAAQALTANNGADDQARKAMVKLTTTTGANFAVYAPPVSKLYVVYNASSYTATVYNSTVLGNTTAAGTGIAVPAGKVMAVWTDGTDFYSQNTHLVSPSMSGTPTAPTAATGTNTTQVATTAFVSATTTAALPAGVIVMWSGSIASVPVGWYLCDGTNGTPNLRDRFVVGAGSTYAVNATGGSADAAVVSHTHTATSTFTGTAMTGHTHGVTDPGHKHLTVEAGSFPYGSSSPNQVSGATYTAQNQLQAYTSTDTTGVSVGSASAGTPAGTVATTNTSTGVSGTNANLPPYLALAYIMKA